MKTTTIGLIITVMVISGCSIKSHYIQSNAVVQKPVASEQVKLYVQAPEGQEYEVIGSVTAYSYDETATINKLKDEARSIGANAVIKLKLHKQSSYHEGSTGASGVAVRFQ